VALSTTTAPATLHCTVRVEIVQTTDLLALLSQDRTFDVFAPPKRDVDGELPALRPAIVTTERLIWGFAYESLFADQGYPRETPIIRVSGDLSRCELIQLALKAENRTGRYLWREIEGVVDLCAGAEGRSESDENEDPHREIPSDLLSLIDTERDVRPSLSVFRRLSKELRTAVDSGGVDLRTAESVTPEMVAIVGELLALTDGASFSERRQIIRMTGEVVRLRDGEVSVIDELRGRNPAEILAVLRRILRPETNRIEEEVDRFRQRYTRGTGVNVALPKNLEGDYIEVSFRARSEQEFLRRIRTLDAMKETVDDLVGLLF
jgi:hypothetical protein